MIFDLSLGKSFHLSSLRRLSPSQENKITKDLEA